MCMAYSYGRYGFQIEFSKILALNVNSILFKFDNLVIRDRVK